MSITERHARTDSAAGAVRQIELFETAMCCETGVCGPSVDERLLAVRENLRWVEAQGASVARHNLTSDPDAFVANPKVTGLMQAFGEGALPVLVLDGEIRVHGHYPAREELAALSPISPRPPRRRRRSRRGAAAHRGRAAECRSRTSQDCRRLIGPAGRHGMCSSPARAASGRLRPPAVWPSRSPARGCGRC